MNKLSSLLCCIGAQILTINAAIAAPVQWSVGAGGNGHYYEVVNLPGSSWAAARDQAAGMSFNGAQGHLATLTSGTENAFVTSLLTASASLQWFIGGAQPAGSIEPLGSWSWITGEAWAYTNWNAPLQPDNHPFYPEGENALSMYSGSTAKRGQWNDTSMTSTVVPASWEQVGGMVVEYNVPEPGSLALTLPAILAALAFRRRSKACGPRL
jgi:hypothetical protein